MAVIRDSLRARRKSVPEHRDMASTPHAGRRMDVELLRVVAVLAVMIFHFAPGDLQLVPNGYLGVDIFFTISGFVITAQMLRARDRGEFTYPSFLARRVRRLLPSAVLVLVVTMIVMLVFANAIFVRQESRAGASAMLYVANFYFAHEAVDYFGINGQDSPFIHFWSLGVEEQFYVVWPIVFLLVGLAVRRYTHRFVPALAAVTIVFGVVSVVGASIAMSDDAARAFFLPWWRAHQLMLGALVALWLHARKPGIADHPRLAARSGVVQWVRIACVAWLIGICLQDWRAVPSPGWQAMFVSVPVAVILATAWIVPKDRLITAGSQSVLAWVAAASYVLYLWHWPIWVVIRDSAGDDANGYALIALALLITFVLSALTHHLVEVPIRDGARIKRVPNLAVIGVGVGGCVLLAVGMVQLAPAASVKAATAPSFVSALQPPLEQLQSNQPDAFRNGCFYQFGNNKFQTCTTGDPAGARTVVLLGDSHAAQWSTALGLAAAQHGAKLITATKNNCAMLAVPVRPPYQNATKECAQRRSQAIELLRRERPDVLVISSDSPWDIPPSLARTDAEKAAVVKSSARESLAELTSLAKKVVVIEDTPHLPSAPDTCLAGAKSVEGCSFPTDRGEPARRALHDAVTGVPNVVAVDPYPQVCPGARCAIVTPQNVIMYFDATHISDTYSRTLAPWVSGWLGRALDAKR